MNVLIIVPAHNEAAAIAGVVAGVRAKGMDVLVIDDGSADQTAALAKTAGAVVISTGRKSGKGNALRMGFDYAIKKGYTAIIAVDGDGQHDPADINAFLLCYQHTNAGLVNGNRMQNPKGMPPVRHATNAFMSWLISLICKQRIPDSQCGFRLITTEVLQNIKLECTDFEIETELLVQASRKGFKIVSVPVATIYRDEVSKINPFRDTYRFVRYIIRTLIRS